MTVMVLLPLCSCIAPTDHVAEVNVPLNFAVPLPPRSFDHRTRYKRMLSPATPFSPIDPDAVMPEAPSTATVGADLSIDLQRRRSA